MNEWAELDRALDALASSGCAEVREDGQWLAELTGLRCEFRAEGKNPLVHLWSEERNLTRRILRVREQSQDRIVLEVQRFGRTKPGRLEFLRTDSPRASARITREQFRARFERFLHRALSRRGSRFALRRSRSRTFVFRTVRARAHAGRPAFMGFSRGFARAKAPPRSTRILAFALLWLEWVRAHSHTHGVEGVRLFVPEGTSRPLRARALALSSAARTEVFEFDNVDGRVEKMDAAELGNLESRLTMRREVESALTAAQESAARIPALAPMLGDVAGRMRANALPGAKEVAFSFHGLEFARWSREGVRFGLGDRLKPLTGTTAPKLEQLVRQLVLYRSAARQRCKTSAVSRGTRAMARDDRPRRARPTRRTARSGSPVFAGSRAFGGRPRRDRLARHTRRGRLVVIELKASEDIQLPIQALDYWLRVRRHQLGPGDFHRYGYFAGKEFDPKPPLVWLVAPGLHFHPATATLVRFFSPEIQVDARRLE